MAARTRFATLIERIAIEYGKIDHMTVFSVP